MAQADRAAHGRLADLVVAAVLAGAFLALLLIHGPINIEQYHHSHPAVRVFHRALLEGRYLFWTDAFGLGTPLPLGENLGFHPLLLLGQALPLRWILSLFWLLHLTVGGFFLLRLCRRLRVELTVARVAALTFIGSIATANYSYTDDWASLFLGWAMLPIIVHGIWTLAAAAPGAAAWRQTGLLVLLLSFVVWNSHLGYLVVLGTSLVCLAALLSGGRWRILLRFATAAAATLLVTSERFYFIASELVRFPPGIRTIRQGPVAPGAWLEQLVFPLKAALLSDLARPESGNVLDSYLAAMGNVRVPFLGAAFFMAAVWTLVSRRGDGESEGRAARAIALTFGLSVVGSLLPPEALIGLASGMWLFRDPAIFFGLLAAGITLSRWRRGGRAMRRTVSAALVLQTLQVALVALPPMISLYRQRQENVRFYAAPRAAELAHWVREATGGVRARAYLSPKLFRMLTSERPLLGEIGLLATGDLENLGLLPVNGYFKGVSMDELYPSFKLILGMIGSEPATLEDPTTRDVLGFEYLLALAEERATLNLAGLEPAAPDLPLADGGALILLHSPTAWPTANLFRPSAASLRLEPRPGCEVEGLLCRDLGPLAEARLVAEVRASGGDDQLLLRFDPAEEERLLVLARLYRPEWKAGSPGWRAGSGSGEGLETLRVVDALLAVRVPAGVSDVRLIYRPRWRVALLLLGGTVLVGCVALLATCRRPSP